MSAPPRPSYETDVLLWSERQGELLRRRAAGELINEAELDWPNIAEEIESLGRSERSALSSRVRTIIEHLAKLEVSPAIEPRGGWEDTVLRARTDIEALLEASPSLRPKLDETIAHELTRALRLVASALTRYSETPRVPLDQIHYNAEQVARLMDSRSSEVSEYSEMRAQIAQLGLTQSGLARRMKELGDDRPEKNILRSIQRIVAGDARFSGEMRALLGLMREMQRASNRRTGDAPR